MVPSITAKSFLRWVETTEEGAALLRLAGAHDTGLIAAWVELETRVKICEEIGGSILDSSLKAHVASALRDAQNSVADALEHAVDVHQVYDQLVAYRTGPRRVLTSDDDSESELWPGHASPPASPLAVVPPPETPDEPRPGDRSQSFLEPFEVWPQPTSPEAELYSEEHRRRWRKGDVLGSGSSDGDTWGEE